MHHGRGPLVFRMLPSCFVLVISSQSWMAHGVQEAALTTAGAWSMTNGPGRRVRSEEPPQAKSSQSILMRKERGEAEDTSVLAARPLSGERLTAFCYLKSSFQRFYKVTPTPQILVGAGGKTCALVSNSGALLARKAGIDIDAHDIVFRFNTAPTQGFEDYVGNKTDYRVGGRFPKPCEHKVCQTFPTGEAFTNHRSYARISHLRHLLRHNAFALSNQTEGLTSGFHGMLHALSVCGSVDAYEITPSKVASKYPYHYWERGENTEDRKHGRNDSGDRADKNLWHGYADVEHELWRWLSTSSEASIAETGKASFPSFSSLNCPHAHR
mmetsp:Transcript_94768/g.148224  ORF Transcript_94768/g.148224 Transcript_94768/m.148224 type:complete len:326 (-) Transcript_94768:77-1054(-)